MNDLNGDTFEPVFTPLPQGLTELRPGPDLSVALAALELRRYNGSQLVDLVVAQSRQISHEQARLLIMLNELAHTPRCEPTSAPERTEARDPHVSSEVAFALTWTEYAATTMLSLAATAVETAPNLKTEMASGRLDLAKLKVIGSELELLEPSAARVVADHVVSEIPTCTTGQLRHITRRLVLQVAPEAARARHEAAVARRRVQRSDFPNGTACVSGMFLAPDKAAAAWDHIEALAVAKKAAGDTNERTIDQIRADVFADLLAGVDPIEAGSGQPGQRRGVINVRVDLQTLAGWSREPADLDGFGPMLADIARQTIAQVAERSQWRFTTVDSEGQTVAEGRLRYRPTLAQRRFVEARDRTCTAPGCRMPAMRCELDHVRSWASSGPTTIDNLTALCKRHHTAKHKGGHRICRSADGLEWITPRGRRYTVVPNGVLPPSELERTLEHLARAENIMSQLRR